VQKICPRFCAVVTQSSYGHSPDGLVALRHGVSGFSGRVASLAPRRTGPSGSEADARVDLFAVASSGW